MSHKVHTAPVPFKLIIPPFFDVQFEQKEVKASTYSKGTKPKSYGYIDTLPKSYNGTKIPEVLRTWVQRIILAECHDIHEGLPLGWAIGLEKLSKAHGKKYKDIMATLCITSDKNVWYVDESEFCSVGHVTPSFIAFDEPSIKAIKKALGGEIECDTTVESWW